MYLTNSETAREYIPAFRQFILGEKLKFNKNKNNLYF